MKILYFLKNGLMTKAALERQFDESANGNKVVFCNGSLNKGFQDSCGKVILDVENPLIEEWAVSKGIDIEVLFDREVEVVTDVPDTDTDSGDGFDGEDIDSLVASQVAKAEVESTLEEATTTEVETEPTVHEVPEFKDIPAGKYVAPDGTVYERKPQGSKLKGDFTAAIQKYGFESFKGVD